MSKMIYAAAAAVIASIMLGGCTAERGTDMAENAEILNTVSLSDDPIELTSGLSAVEFTGDSGFDSFLEQGGAQSDQELVEFLARNVIGEDISGGILSDIFGCSTIAAAGADANGMYLFDDLNYVEIENGTMYVTSLYNYAQPLIRYKLSDKLAPAEPDMTGPYQFTKVKSIVGRNEDIMWFENRNGEKEFIHPLAIEGFCIEGMRDYQFRQIGIDAFEMHIELSDKNRLNQIRAEILFNMEKILKEKKLENVQFYVCFTDEIAPDPNTGKKKLVIKDINEKSCVFS